LVRSTLDEPSTGELADTSAIPAGEPASSPEPASAVLEATASAPGLTDRIVVPETDPADQQLELF
jgi:hypothetical protein